MDSRHRGVVKRFDDARGFGFVKADGGYTKDIFVHQTAIIMSGFRTLSQGDEVEFDIEASERGPVAKNVVKVEPSQPVVDDLDMAPSAADEE